MLPTAKEVVKVKEEPSAAPPPPPAYPPAPVAPGAMQAKRRRLVCLYGSANVRMGCRARAAPPQGGAALPSLPPDWASSLGAAEVLVGRVLNHMGGVF